MKIHYYYSIAIYTIIIITNISVVNYSTQLKKIYNENLNFIKTLEILKAIFSINLFTDRR